MQLIEIVDSLDDSGKIKLAIDFLELALPIWEDAYDKKERITFSIEQVGLHIFFPEIVLETINLAKEFVNPNSVFNKSQLKEKANQLILDYVGPFLGRSYFELWLEVHSEDVFDAAYYLSFFLDGQKKVSYREENTAYISIMKSVEILTRMKKLSFDEVNLIAQKYYTQK
jgi:hypothetical protein